MKKYAFILPSEYIALLLKRQDDTVHLNLAARATTQAFSRFFLFSLSLSSAARLEFLKEAPSG